MPGVEQNTPSGPLPQERQPSVHAVQEALGPLANSSSRGSALPFDAGTVTRGTFECLVTSGRSAASVGCVRSVEPQRPASAKTTAITAIRNLRGTGCSLDMRFPTIGFFIRQHRENGRARLRRDVAISLQNINPLASTP
jgi:hypothetical protein